MLLDLVQKYRSDAKRNGFVYPCYEDYSFANIPNAVLAQLGLAATDSFAEVFAQAGVTRGPKKVVLFLVDGFGYTQFLRYADEHPFLKSLLNKGVVASATAVFPSTTAAALTSIHSGLTPREHGLPEWLVHFAEVGALINTLPFKTLHANQATALDGVPASALFSGKTIYERLAASGVPSFVLDHKDHAGGAYSSVVYRGSNEMHYADVSTLFATLRAHLEVAPSPSYTYVYWGDIDAIAHDHGPHSQKYRESLSHFFGSLQNEFIAKCVGPHADDVTLIVTADHGQVRVDPKATIYLDQFPMVVDNLALGQDGEPIAPWGSARDVFLAIRQGKVGDVVSFLAEVLHGKATVMTTTAAMLEGLFGKGNVHPQFWSRVGNVLIIPNERNTVWFRHFKDKKYRNPGIHGGLHEDEMLVPLAVARLSALR